MVYTSPGVLHWCGRVAVLVSEGKFEKAEQLVQEFNLEPEVVLCSLLAPMIVNCLTLAAGAVQKDNFLEPVGLCWQRRNVGGFPTVFDTNEGAPLLSCSYGKFILVGQ